MSPSTTLEPIELLEYRSAQISPERLAQQDAELLWRRFSNRITVEFPSPRTQGDYKLTAHGWAGYLPVSPTLALRLRPRVPLANLFRMLEVAYDLRGFELLPGLTDCHSLDEFFERLAKILASRILARSRRGFCREYFERRERLGAVRGRIDLEPMLRAPWRTRIDCRFEEHTADVEDNQILLWTLDRIRRNAACRRPEVRRTVRQAFGRLNGLVTPRPFSATDCQDRIYTRLNDDYRALHSLCRFFLEHTGPTHEAGDRRNLPFLVDMAGLFELFVAKWLRLHLPPPRSLDVQKTVRLGDGRLSFTIDGVLYDHSDGRPRAVFDTKYKPTQNPTTADVFQIVAYAEACDCRDAFLIYPIPLTNPMDLHVGRIRVRTLGFELGGDLEAAGERMLLELLESRSW